MANQNQYLTFAGAGGALVLSAAAYQALAARQTGFEEGIADPQELNTVWRQASTVAAAFGQFCADFGPGDVLDDGSASNLETQFRAALNVYANVPSIPSISLFHEGDDFGGVNQLVVNCNPALPTYSKGHVILVWPANRNTSSCVINAGAGNVPLVRRNGTSLQPGDILPGQPFMAAYDGAQFRLTSLSYAEVPIIVQNVVIYVATNGNDGNDGSATDPAHALATLDAAFAMVARFAFATSQVIIKLADGTYPPAKQVFPATSGNVLVLGNQATPGNVVIQGAPSPGAGALAQTVASLVTYRGITWSNTGGGASIVCSANAIVAMDNCNWNAPNNNAGAFLQIQSGSAFSLGTNCHFTGNAANLLTVDDAHAGMGTLGTASDPNATNIYLDGTPNFGTLLVASEGGIINILSGFNFNGGAKGRNVAAITNGIVNIGQAQGRQPTFVPGDQAYFTSTGGQYL